MPNNEDEWIDKIIESSIVVDLRDLTDGEESTMSLGTLRAAIQAKLLEARLMERELIELEIAASHKKRYAQLQASAPTKKGEDRA